MNAQTWAAKDEIPALDRLKDALERDWEQTKADLLGDGIGRELHQDIGHTLKQLAGTEGIPSLDLPTCDTDEVVASAEAQPADQIDQSDDAPFDLIDIVYSDDVEIEESSVTVSPLRA